MADQYTLQKILGGLDIVDALKYETSPNAALNSAAAQFSRDVLQPINGIKQISDVKQYFENNEGTLSSIAKLYTSNAGSSDSKIIKDIKDESFSKLEGMNLEGTTKKLSAITIQTGSINYGNLSSRIVATYMNMLPPTVVNSLVPYVDVEFEFMYPKGAFEDDKKNLDPRVKPPGLLRFLMGNDQVKGETANEKMFKSRLLEGSEDSEGNPAVTAYAGMEMFTSPITLANPGINSFRAGNAAVLDPFAPFMTLTGFDVSVKSAGRGTGMIGTKTASLKMVLHDRSRLTEISELLQPVLYTGIVVWITYGMRYTATAPLDDPYAELINNNMLLKEAYRISNSKYSIDKNQINIDLDLTTTGYDELLNFPPSSLSKKVTRSGDDKNAGGSGNQPSPLDTASKNVRKILSSLAQKSNLSSASEVMGQQIIKTMTNLTKLNSGEFNKQLEEFNKALVKSKQDIKDPNVVTALKNLQKEFETFSGTGKDGKLSYTTALEQLEKNVNASISTAFDAIFSSALKDMVLSQRASSTPAASSSSKSATARRVNGKPLPAGDANTRSLGHMLVALLGPAALSQPNVEEVQFVFYGLNGSAAKQSGKSSVAELEIEASRFKELYAVAANEKGGEVLTLSELVGNIILPYVTDPRSTNYGLANYYDPWDPRKSGEIKKGASDNKEFQEIIGNFKRPNLAIFVTSHPLAAEKTGSAGSSDLLLKFERSAAYKKRSGSKSKLAMLVEVIDLQDDEGVSFSGLRGDWAEVSGQKGDQALKAINDALTASGYKNSVTVAKSKDTGGQEKYYVKFDSNEAVKRFIARVLPTLTVGTQGSAIIAASVESNQNQQLNTALTIKAFEGFRPGQSLGSSGPYGLPVTLIPQTLSLTTLGCPLLRYMQTFFVDFGTGTTLDNRYSIVDITHSFKPGSYTTGMRLSPYTAYGAYQNDYADLSALIEILKTNAG